MDIKLRTRSKAAWSTIIKCIDNAVVFVDPHAGECIHWCIGTSALVNKGPVAVTDFSGYKFCASESAQNASKAVFISPCPISTIQVDLCDILSQSYFKTVIIIVSPMIDSSNVIPKLKQDVIHWMSINAGGSVQGLYVDVVLFPFFIAPLTESVIILPSFSDVFPNVNSNKFSSLGAQASVLSAREQATLNHLAVNLDAILHQLDVADIVYSLGPFSSAVGAALEGLSSAHQRRKNAQHRMSVVLVDRIFDLFTPSSVDFKCFFDKIFGALPHLPQHSIDVAVNMSPLAQVTVDSAQEESLFPGCLAHQDSMCENIIELLIHKKDRDVLLYLHKTLGSKTHGSKVTTRVKPETLEKIIHSMRGDYEKIEKNCGILQVALAVIQTLTGEHAEESDLLLSTERVLCQNVRTSLDENELIGLLPQLTKLVVERHIRGLTLDSLLTLLILLYSMVGSDLCIPLKDEVQLQAAISTAIFEDQECPGITHTTLIPLECSLEKCDAVAANIFLALKSVCHARRDLTNYKSILKGRGNLFPQEQTPLLLQVLKDITDPSEPVSPDLLCHSTGLKDLLRSGFSMLLNKQPSSVTQHPANQPNLMLFVLGGITGGEIRLAQEVWTSLPISKSGGSLLIGSSSVLTPSDTLHALLKSSQTYK